MLPCRLDRRFRRHAVAAAPACQGSDGRAAVFEGRQTYLWRADALQSVKAAIAKDPRFGSRLWPVDRRRRCGP
ncbi:MAG: hypothetical protein WDN06_22315 [Asticcacaulis sp.]